ncbi:MAG: hypothetical protein GY816_21765 [Cytophagales bacterium]|nr:hypothetical protein [Cytophagales bacterium]
MSKTLYLMRHGQAMEGNPDHDRELTDRGMRDARRQGKNVFHDEIPDRFIVSSATRTAQTIAHIREELKFDEKRIQFEASMYNAAVRELFGIVTNLDNLWLTVCLIGHNPSITYLAEYLTGDSVGNVNPAGVVKMRIDGSWANISQRGAYFEFYRASE